MRNPLRHHNKKHADRNESFEDCWVCARDQAICKSKIQFRSWQEVDDWIRDRHETQRYAPPWMVRYRCRWCDLWHMKTAKDPRARARVEKQRRKWLSAQDC